MIRSVERVLDILLLFSFQNPRWSIAEISRETGIPKTTVFNLVHTLEAKGFVRQDEETQKYTLGHKLFSLGSTMVETLDINQKAFGPSHHLAERTGLNCKVALWDDDAVIVTVDIAPAHLGFLAKRLGPRLVAYCSALGRPFLAHMDPDELESYLERTELVAFTRNTITDREELLRALEQVRVQGYSINHEEITEGRSSIGFPVFRKDNKVVTTLCLDGDSPLILGEGKEKYIQELRDTAAEISFSMGWRSMSPGELG